MKNLLLLLLFFIFLSILAYQFLSSLQSEFSGYGAWQERGRAGPLCIKTLTSFNENVIAAGLQAGKGRKGGLSLSTDGGYTWVRNKGLPMTNEVTSIVRLFAQREVLVVSIFDNNRNNVGGVYLSHDFGSNWESSQVGLPTRDIRTLELIPGTPPTILAGTVDHGIFRSTDEGLTWHSANHGLSALKIQDIAVSPVQPELIYAATLKGLFRSTDGALTWNHCPITPREKPAMVLQVVPHPTIGSIIYALERPPGPRTPIWRSDNKGNTWHECGHKGTPSEFHPRCMILDPANPKTLFIGTVFDGVYRSDDGGKSWSAINNGLPITQRNIIVHSLEILPGDPQSLLAGTDNMGKIYALAIGTVP